MIVGGIVAFMAMDDYCRKSEKNALRFLMLAGVALTAIGVWELETDRLREVSFHDWALLGFLPIFLLHLRLKSNLVKKQSWVRGRQLSLFELKLDAIPEKRLVTRLRILSAFMWVYAVAVLFVHLWGTNGVSI